MSTDMLAPAIPASQQSASGAMPGWHIYADLTPPELIAARAVRKVRVWVAIALVLVVAVIGAGYQFARMQAAEAADTVAVERAIGDTLRAQQQQFSGVTSIQGSITAARAQLATLMASDVDVDALLGRIWAALPEGMTIDQLSITIPPLATSSGDTRSGTGALDTSDAAHIGTATLSGTGQQLADLSTFVDRLRQIDGIFDPYPTSNDVADEGTEYSLQLVLTDALLSGLYAVEEEH